MEREQEMGSFFGANWSILEIQSTRVPAGYVDNTTVQQKMQVLILKALL